MKVIALQYTILSWNGVVLDLGLHPKPGVSLLVASNDSVFLCT